jgi:hypothetical protein
MFVVAMDSCPSQAFTVTRVDTSSKPEAGSGVPQVTVAPAGCDRRPSNRTLDR